MKSVAPEIDGKDFLFGGIASSMATVFTNPLEVSETSYCLNIILTNLLRLLKLVCNYKEKGMVASNLIKIYFKAST